MFVDIDQQSNVTMVLAYGTLLSYHRYQNIMPWEADADVHVIQREIDYLCDLIQQQKHIVIPDHVWIFLRRDSKNSSKKCNHALALITNQRDFTLM